MHRGTDSSSKNGILGVFRTCQQLFIHIIGLEYDSLSPHNPIQKGILWSTLCICIRFSLRPVHTFRGFCMARFINVSSWTIVCTPMEPRDFFAIVIFGRTLHRENNKKEN